MRNPAVAGNILRVLVFCGLTLGPKLMTQEESHPDQEGHADNRRRRQSGQVTEQGTLLSGRPAGLPSRTAAPSQPAFIGVTTDEHWVICTRAYLCIVAHTQSEAGCALPVAGRDNSRRPEAGAGAAGRETFPPHQSCRLETAGTRRHARGAGAGRRGTTAWRAGVRAAGPPEAPPRPDPGHPRRPGCPGGPPAAPAGPRPSLTRAPPQPHPGTPRRSVPGGGPPEDRPGEAGLAGREAGRPRALTRTTPAAPGRRGRIPDVAGESAGSSSNPARS